MSEHINNISTFMVDTFKKFGIVIYQLFRFLYLVRKYNSIFFGEAIKKFTKENGFLCIHFFMSILCQFMSIHYLISIYI